MVTTIPPLALVWAARERDERCTGIQENRKEYVRAAVQRQIEILNGVMDELDLGDLEEGALRCQLGLIETSLKKLREAA